jgi:hypothetical protein
MLLAREIGTTLLFIRSPTYRRRDGLRQKHLPNRDKIPLAGSPVSTAAQPFWGWPSLYSGPDTLG